MSQPQTTTSSNVDEEGKEKLSKSEPPKRTSRPVKASEEQKSYPRTTSHASSAWAPWDYYEERVRETPSGSTSIPSRQSFHRRPTERMGSRSRGGSKLNDEEGAPTQQQDEKPYEPSLPDRIAESALWSTLEFLKIAGGVTLSTTGKLVAPPLHVTRTVILPSLWQASMDALASATPDRVKDWFRIVSSSFHHFFAVLGKTERGAIFRQRFLVSLSDLVDLLCVESARQAFLDGTACMVKFSEVLNTPECHAWVEQVGIWACRLVQVASEGKTQELIHNTVAAWHSFFQLAADPHTTMAFAEVTAYLCHALEMQQSQPLFRDPDDAENEEKIQEERAKRRQERDQYQTVTNLDRVMVQDPSATVEQVILSSLGVPQVGDDGSVVDDEISSVPSRIVCSDKDHSETQEKETASAVDWDASSIRQQVDDTSVGTSRKQEQGQTFQPIHRNARREIDKKYLEQQIYARADDLELKSKQSREEPVDFLQNVMEAGCDIEDLGLEFPSAKRKRIQLKDSDAKGGSPAKLGSQTVSIDNPLPVEGETPVQHFYRILDEILEKKRKEALQNVDTAKLSGFGSVKSRRKFASQVQTLKERLAAHGIDPEAPEKLARGLSPRSKRLVLLTLSFLAMLLVSWFFLGCYGLYQILFPRRNAGRPLPVHPSKGSKSNEIVIRVVREVVNLDADGNYIGQYAEGSSIEPEKLDKIASCVANVVN